MKRLSRREFLKWTGIAAGGTALTLAGCAPKATPTPVPAAKPTEVAMPLKGTNIKVLISDMTYSRFLEKIKGDFEKATGINVEMEILGWPVMLQQTEVELSSGSGTYDAAMMIFIKAQKWMRPGWVTALDDYIARDAAEVDFDDFMTETTNKFQWEGKQYGLPWLAECTMMLYRKDLLDKQGLKPPETFDDLAAVSEKIHNPPDFYAFVQRLEPNGVHFPWPIWQQGYGGNIFRDPPNDMTPTLNTPESITATEAFVKETLDYGIQGSQPYTTPDCQTAIGQGNAGIWIDALGIFAVPLDPEQSKVSDKLAIALPPGGPAGQFPQIATHGWEIPKGAKNKDAGWEWIKWSLSKDVLMRAATESSFSAVPRKSVLTSKEYADKYTIAGTNTGDLIAAAFSLSKCEYRVVPEFPEIGQRLGQGIGEIVSGQKGVKDALDAVQKDAVQIMKTAGYDLKEPY